jgi:hypothetical protein
LSARVNGSIGGGHGAACAEQRRGFNVSPTIERFNFTADEKPFNPKWLDLPANEAARANLGIKEASSAMNTGASSYYFNSNNDLH